MWVKQHTSSDIIIAAVKRRTTAGDLRLVVDASVMEVVLSELEEEENERRVADYVNICLIISRRAQNSIP